MASDGGPQARVSRQRFVAEAEITRGLEHPGVVPVYTAWTPTTAYGPITPCGSSRVSRSRKPSRVSTDHGGRVSERWRGLR
jgi:hypothetical protein